FSGLISTISLLTCGFWPFLAFLIATGRNLPSEILFAVSGAFLGLISCCSASPSIRVQRWRPDGIVMTNGQGSVASRSNTDTPVPLPSGVCGCASYFGRDAIHSTAEIERAARHFECWARFRRFDLTERQIG